MGQVDITFHSADDGHRGANNGLAGQSQGVDHEKDGKQFQNHKKRTWAKYVKSGKITPEFKGTDERLRDHWDDFVTYKESEEALERSKKNADNAKKKVLHHNLGPGGHKTAMPKWDKLKAEIKAKGLTPETEKVPERAGNFVMAHGMTLEKETGELVLRDPTKKAVLTPFDDLKKAVAEVEAGTFIPDRENDELTKALGNPEKGGRTRGYGGVPWKMGFHEDYKMTGRWSPADRSWFASAAPS